jgi:hypothetical protein
MHTPVGQTRAVAYYNIRSQKASIILICYLKYFISITPVLRSHLTLKFRMINFNVGGPVLRSFSEVGSSYSSAQNFLQSFAGCSKSPNNCVNSTILSQIFPLCFIIKQFHYKKRTSLCQLQQ